MIYHVLNRGNGRMRIFHKPEDFAAFERMLAEGLERYAVELLTYCLMPNHWHLVTRPKTDDALGRWMRWVGVTHVRRYHEHYHSRGGGHVYQGRFKSFPVAEDDYFVALCRYVEGNALRAGLVNAPSSGTGAGSGDGARARRVALESLATGRSRNWVAWVNRGLNDEQMEGIRTCVQRERPLGPEAWVRRTAKRLGLEFTLRGPGRPRKTANNQ